MNDVISAENLCHSFADHHVLNHISFQIKESEIFGLLGPSGAGKTTLIKILTGQLLQNAGNARLFGKDSRNLTASEHSRIGIMMDHLGLYERLSAYDNLRFYADIYHTSHSSIPALLKEFGLYEARKIPVFQFSKGMKNRLSLARALLNHAGLLFLDEPTCGLDPVAAREIHTILKMQKEKGTTIFLTTHNMQEAECLCDNIALLSGGSMIECGSPADICKRHNHLNRLEITFTDGTEVSLENKSQSAPLLIHYLEHNLIASIHSTEPTLDDVFIELTGKGLDDNEQYMGNIKKTVKRYVKK